MKKLAHCGLIMLDELAYVPLDVESARLLFQVASACHERRSAITPSRPLTWAQPVNRVEYRLPHSDREPESGRIPPESWDANTPTTDIPFAKTKKH